jgi:acetate kinase
MEDKKTHRLITKGNYEMIGTQNSKLTIKINGEKIKIDHPAKDFEEGIAEILNLLVSDEYKILNSFL